MPAARSPRHTGGTGRYDRSRGASARLTIGKVIARLEPDFPDLTVSKVRFLESEGLLTPERTGSGYRTYSESDVERLRYILTVQREHFWRDQAEEVVVCLGHGLGGPVLVDGADLELLQVTPVRPGSGGFARRLVCVGHSLLVASVDR